MDAVRAILPRLSVVSANSEWRRGASLPEARRRDLSDEPSWTSRQSIQRFYRCTQINLSMMNRTLRFLALIFNENRAIIANEAPLENSPRGRDIRSEFDRQRTQRES